MYTTTNNNKWSLTPKSMTPTSDEHANPKPKPPAAIAKRKVKTYRKQPWDLPGTYQVRSHVAIPLGVA